jgi:hypothetical protein
VCRLYHLYTTTNVRQRFGHPGGLSCRSRKLTDMRGTSNAAQMFSSVITPNM